MADLARFIRDELQAQREAELDAALSSLSRLADPCERESFEAYEVRHGRPQSALYRTPAGEYEDAEVARAWETWRRLRRIRLMPATD